MMLEQIYYKETNLDEEGNFTMDITKNNAVSKRKFWSVKNILSWLLNKACKK